MLGPVPQHLYVSHYKVYKTVCALKTKKSPGPDGIPIFVWNSPLVCLQSVGIINPVMFANILIICFRKIHL